MKTIDEDILKAIHSRCGGIPLLCFQYFVNMIHAGFIQINNRGHSMPTENFLVAEELDDWSGVPVPRQAWKQASSLLSEFLSEFMFKAKKKPGL